MPACYCGVEPEGLTQNSVTQSYTALLCECQYPLEIEWLEVADESTETGDAGGGEVDGFLES